MNNDPTNIFGRRLRQARRMKGMSMADLGNALTPGITRQAINKYENGQTLPDSRMLLAFGEALSVKPDYFFRPFTVEVDSVMFRKDTKFPEKNSTIIRERVREELERYIEAEQICGAETSSPLRPVVVSTTEGVVEYADKVRSMLRLGADGISNVIEVLEDNGIKVIEISEDDTFDGMSGYANDIIPIIVVNSNTIPERKRFTLLHELGHLLIRFNSDIKAKEVENLCNIFANELLLPASVVLSRIGKKRHDISLAELTNLQRQYGISIDMIMDKILQLDIITPRRYEGYLRKKRSFPAFKSIVEQSMAIPETSGRFVRMVYRALADETISFSKAASLLNTSVESVKQQLQLV